MPQRMQVQFEGGRPDAEAADDILRMLVMGDFSGRGRHAAVEPAAGDRDWPLVAVEVDTLDAVMTRWAPAVRLALDTAPGDTMEIAFRTLDDFHPDALFHRVPLFQDLRRLRERLLDPATFAAAAAELGAGPAEPVPPADSGETLAAEATGDLLERLLGRRPAGASPALTAAGRSGSGAESVVDRLLQNLVQPHVVPAPDTRQPQLLAAVDLAIGERMRALLHHPTLQALEAAWRNVHRLVTELETGAELRVCLLDVSRAELAADLRTAGGDLQASRLYRRLVADNRVPGGRPWSLLVGDYAFGAEADDVALLTFLGILGAQAGAPFLGAARSDVLGCRSLVEEPDSARWQPPTPDTEQRWRALRSSPVAPWLGLALPRVLLRLPYGQQTDPIDSFDFEEMPAGAAHEGYLWGNPAGACALLLGRAFLDHGRPVPLDAYRELEDLPAHTFVADDETRLQPCAEVVLSEIAAQRMLDCGVMPLLSYRNRNAVRLWRWQSLAYPPAMLAGPWA